MGAPPPDPPASFLEGGPRDLRLPHPEVLPASPVSGGRPLDPAPSRGSEGPIHSAPSHGAQKPWNLRRSRIPRDWSLLMSAFALPTPPADLATRLLRPTERSATARPWGSSSPLRCAHGAPVHSRRAHPRPVRSYAFLRGWLLPSPPPGCLRVRPSFPTGGRLRDLSVRAGLFPFRPSIFAPKVCLRRVLAPALEGGRGERPQPRSTSGPDPLHALPP